MDHKYVPGMGPTGAKVLILGEAPSYEETHAGRPFVGPSGRELDRLLKDAGIPRSDCWITNVCKYEVPPNTARKKLPFHVRARNHGIDMDQQLSELRVEINEIKPNVILALGGTALWALSGKDKITKHRGSLMWGMDHKFVPTYHPAHLLHSGAGGEIKGYWNRQVMIFDFKRAWDERLDPQLNIPGRVLQVCRNSGDLYEFLEKYKDHKKMSVDIEAGGHCLPICIGLSFNKSHGMVVPLWNRDGISTIPDSDLAACWMMLTNVLWSKHIVGQNFNYDRDKLKRLGFSIRRIHSDTMLKAFAINPELPKGLAFNTSIYTREPFYKDDGMYEGSIRDLLVGCARDACVTLEIDEAMDADLEELGITKFYKNFLMKLPDFYAEIENNGFRIDEEKRLELIEKYVTWDERLGYEMYKIAGVDINVNSPVQVYSFLFDEWKLPRRPGVGEEELTALLNLKSGVKAPDQREWIEKCLERRRVKKTVSTYLFAIPDYDKKMRTTCFPCLNTGRSSTGQQEPPIRPLVDVVGKGAKKDMKVMGTAFQVFTKHGDIGADVRGMYLPDEGEIFVNLDSSQAEARVVFNLATDEQALKDIDEHDYHALTASWFFGGTEADYSKKVLGYESPIRFAGKTLRHAGHLGAGARRASTELNTQARKYKIPITINEGIADRALKIFHARQPKIQRVFHAQIIECLKLTRRLVAPLPWGIDAERGGVRIFYERWGDDLFREALAYIPQRAVSDNTKAAGIRIKKQFREAKIILEAHDALLFSIRAEYLDEFIPLAKKEMERPINFTNCSLPRRFLKIPCDVEVGENYKDLRKFKGKDEPVRIEVPELINVRELTVTEQFTVTDEEVRDEMFSKRDELKFSKDDDIPF
jgi:uracil-DNA glycosylase family 4